MKILYNIFCIIFSLVYLPYLLIKGKYHKDFFQKLGFIPEDIASLDSPIWIHAVSVGEVNLAVKVGSALKKSSSDVPVIVSTTTSTGNDLARKNINKGIDKVFYYPLDITVVVRRVIKAVKPSLYMIIETELWPNMIEEMHAEGVPVVIINGRLSDSSFRNYKKISFVTKSIFRSVDIFCMQSELDAFRVKELGAPEEKVFVPGNLKFDELSKISGSETFSKKDFGFGEKSDIIVAGSTHYPEENLIIDIFKRLKETRRGLRLILAPRHIERIDAISVYCETAGMRYDRLSEFLGSGSLSVKDPEVLLVDTIGHLKDLYELASIVFIGGSITDRGGQNPIEAAARGKAVVFGPNMTNFRQVSGLFLDNDASCRVRDEKDLERVLGELVDDPSRRQEISRNAEKVISDNDGAVKRTIETIERFLKK